MAMKFKVTLEFNVDGVLSAEELKNEIHTRMSEMYLYNGVDDEVAVTLSNYWETVKIEEQ